MISRRDFGRMLAGGAVAALAGPHFLRSRASERMRLTDLCASAPVCSLSRCGLLTGRTPYRLGIRDWIPNNAPMASLPLFYEETRS